MDDLAAREDPSRAASHLVIAVRRGSFVTMLGAGASQGIGLPGWDELVEACCAATKVTFEKANLTEVMDEVYDAARTEGREPSEVVREVLYRKLDATAGYGIGSLQSPLLLALGALIMSGARLGSAEVFTWNFDDVLESYLTAHGFAVQVITTDEFDIRGDVDAHVFHPHGYLPLTHSHGPPELVLSRSEFLDRLAENADMPWPATIISHLMGRTAIAVGISFSDDNLLQLMNRVRKSRTDPIAYSLGVYDEKQAKKLRRYGIVPVRFDTYEDIAPFLLQVCTEAADSYNV